MNLTVIYRPCTYVNKTVPMLKKSWADLKNYCWKTFTYIIFLKHLLENVIKLQICSWNKLQNEKDHHGFADHSSIAALSNSLDLT